MSFTCTLFSDKVRCFNQSKRALYENFIIISFNFTYKTVTNKVILNFHLFLLRAISLRIYQRIPFKNLRALSLSLRSQLWVLLLSDKFLLKGTELFKSIQHWRSLRALDFILSVIGNGYKILFISMPPPRRFTNLERLSWNSCVAILSRKSFLRRTLSIPALAVSVQVNGEKRLILDLRLIDLHVHKQNLRVRNCLPLRTFLPKSFCFVFWFKVRLPSHRHFSRSSQIFGFLVGVYSRPYEIFPQFTVLPFDLSSAPYIFTKLLKVAQ